MSKYFGQYELDRFLEAKGHGWYVATREGMKGPFVARRRAEIYLEALKRTSPNVRAVLWKNKVA